MSFFAELKRRNVVRVGAAYIVLGWVIAQVAEFAFDTFGAPDWALKSVVIVLVLGLPLVLFFAWAFELTPEGVKREKDVDHSRSITRQTGRKLDRTIIVVLLVAVGWFAWDKFLAPGDPQPVAAGNPASGTSALAQALTGRADKSVAVLPFIAMSNGPDDEYFADGLTEEILNSLAQLPELLVTARTSAFSFKGQDVPVQEIARVLGVRHIVEGSVRRSGERLRVTAQLIRAADGFHLWSENYDSTSTDTISVQESIAEQIASAMDIVLDERKREAMKSVGLRDVEAFTLYQKGLDLFEDAHGETDFVTGLKQANAIFEQVIAQVPDFGAVYADHADLYLHVLNDAAYGTGYPGISDEFMATAYANAIADYEAAVRHSRTPEARGFAELDLAFINGNWRGLTGRMEKAYKEPGCSDGSWSPMFANVFGFSATYLERSYLVLACDPRRSLSWFNAARAAIWAGDRTEALRLAEEGMQIAPGTWLADIYVRALVVNDQTDLARQIIDDHIRDPLNILQLRILAAAHEGDRPAVDRLILELEAQEGVDRFHLITAYAHAGRRDAVNRLAAVVDEQAFGASALAQLVTWCACGSPWDLDATPRFAAKLRDSGLPWPPAAPIALPLKDW